MTLRFPRRADLSTHVIVQQAAAKSSPAASRFAYLDGVRAVAISAVVGIHWVSPYAPVLKGGYLGVDIFFVLSGFIITTVIWRTPIDSSPVDRWLAFMRRRVVRLYPALLGVVLGSILLFHVTPGAALSADVVARRGLIALGQGSSFFAAAQSGGTWVPGLQPFAQTWSLSIEWMFYALWPIAIYVLRARAVPARIAAIGSLGVAALFYLPSLTLSGMWFYFGPSARFPELLVGGALALHLQDRRPRVAAQRWGPALSSLSFALIIALVLFGPGTMSDAYRYVALPLIVFASTALIYAGYVHAKGPIFRLLSSRPCAALGRSSYSLYLWHAVPLVLLDKDVSTLPVWALGAIGVSMTALLTAASYHFLERPFLRPRSDVLRPGSIPLARVAPAVAKQSTQLKTSG